MPKLKRLFTIAARRRFYRTGHGDGKLLESRLAVARRRPRGSPGRRKMAARLRRLRRILPGNLAAGGGIIRPTVIAR